MSPAALVHSGRRRRRRHCCSRCCMLLQETGQCMSMAMRVTQSTAQLPVASLSEGSFPAWPLVSSLERSLVGCGELFRAIHDGWPRWYCCCTPAPYRLFYGLKSGLELRSTSSTVPCLLTGWFSLPDSSVLCHCRVCLPCGWYPIATAGLGTKCCTL